jgi:hypothetical protein
MIASGWGDQRVTIRALLLLGGVSLALASLASAQSPAPNPTPPAALDPPTAPAPPPPAVSAPSTMPAPATLNQPGMPPQRIHAMVRASGFDPIGAPVRRGDLYVQRAIDPDGIRYRIVIDPLTGRTVSVRPLRAAGPYDWRGPYGPFEPYRAAFGHYFGPPPYRPPHPPRNVPTARLAPPQPLPPPSQPSQPQQSDQPRPQPTTTAQAPLPRPKPYVMEATGSIPIDAPPSPAPQKTPEPQKAAAAPAPAPQSNGAAALPPVAPLD